MTRTWVCPFCGNTTKWSYCDLADAGCPICDKCDADMELPPGDYYWVLFDHNGPCLVNTRLYSSAEIAAERASLCVNVEVLEIRVDNAEMINKQVKDAEGNG